jgi:hypothetical protein
MSEDFNLSELVIPGTYIRVRAEGLISAGGISTGNIGIVGTAEHAWVPDLDEAGKQKVDANGKPVFKDDFAKTFNPSDLASAQQIFGRYDAFGKDSKFNLMRALGLLFASGARTIYARAIAAGAFNKDAYDKAFGELLKEDVNILVAPELSTENAAAVLGVVDSHGEKGKDVIAVLGCDDAQDDPDKVLAVAVGSGRIILCTPGLRVTQTLEQTAGDKTTLVSQEVTLPGTYTAAAVAGLISSLTPQTSPTNKVVPGLTKLSRRFTYTEKMKLLNRHALVLEERRGVRVVRGLTTDAGPFSQITTRRITDFAKAGIRKASDPFIGRLNNERVRKALHGAIDGFLTTMVQDEALIGYELEVTATRADEIAGRAMVNAILQPTFSIDFIAVTMVLQ